MIDNKLVFNKIKNSKNPPSLPQFLLKLIEICNNDDVSLLELSRIISQDPATSIKIMRLTNSSYFGSREKFTGLEKAVIYLGTDAIKNVAISTSVMQIFSGAKGSNLFDLNRFWWHSFMCASLARRIAIVTSYEFVEEAFLSGLLHDIGKLLLWVNFTKDYTLILGRDDNKGLINAEEKIIGVTHCEVGAWLIKEWKLKSFMADAILYHHDSAEKISNNFPLVKIVFVANAICNGYNSNNQAGFKASESIFGFDKSQVEKITLEAKKEVEQVALSLEIPLEPPEVIEQKNSDKKNNKHQDLLLEVKNISLIGGTLQNLLKADSKESILMVVKHGLKILFGIEQMFFFIYDFKNKYLIRYAAEEEQANGLINQRILFCNDNSIIAKSLAERNTIDSFSCFSDKIKVIADEEIINQLGTEGMLCIPMVAQKKQIGVITLGISSYQHTLLSKQLKLLNMFAAQAAICLFAKEIQQKQTEKIVSERLDAASMIARKVAHEVNNPLVIIKNYLKILELKLSETNLIKDDLKIINEEIDRITNTIGQLSDYSLIKKNKCELFDINILLSEILEILKKAILTPNGINLNFEADFSLPKIMTDRNKIKQVIVNLVKNSKEAMPNGGDIYVKTKRISVVGNKLCCTGQKNTEILEITIKDNGPGIDDNILSHIFEPLQGPKGNEHSGLGLSIAHSIIKKLKGSIRCISKKGKGTCFKINLPFVYQKN